MTDLKQFTQDAIRTESKIEKVKVRITPRILVLTATILWHSTILRPNDIGYFTQEEIDNKFEKSITAARYLRQELGITDKKYSGLDDFNLKLEGAIPLRKQMEVDYEKIPEDKFNQTKKRPLFS